MFKHGADLKVVSEALGSSKHLRDIVDVLAEADPEDTADLYADIGVTLAYHTDGRVAVQALPRGDKSSCRRGDLRLEATPQLRRVVALAA